MNPRGPDETRRPPVGPGDRVSHFEILELISSGGMGVVFHARDLNLPREVALKCPWPDLVAVNEVRGRFHREGRIDSQLSHPNIVRLYEVFEDRGLPWLAMEYVDGGSLSTLITREGKLEVNRALGFGIDISKALAYAHGKGILHRDLNPRNILVTSDDRVLVSDFGIARLLHAEPPTADRTTSVYTSEGRVIGTPHYMSPEQVLGRELTVTSDIFSFGMVLYEMVTGKKPFHSMNPSQLQDAILNREPDPVSRHTYECPEELERIIRKCLAKRPDERYPDAEGLVVDLRALVRERTASVSAARAESVVRRRPRWPLWAGAGVLLGILGLAGVRLLGTDSWVRPTSPVQITSHAAWEGEPAPSPDGRHIAYASNQGGNLDIYVVDTDGGQALRLTEDPLVDADPTWFPDGREIAFVSERSGRRGIYKIHHLGGTPTLLVMDAWSPTVSPDGKLLAFVRSDSLGIEHIAALALDSDEGIRSLTPDEEAWLRWGPEWSPDGRSICYSTRDHLKLLTVATGTSRVLTSGGVEFSPCWSSDGKHVYFSSDRGGTVALWRTDLKGKMERVTAGTGPETSPATSRDGSVLAYGTTSTDYDIVVMDMDTGRESRIPGTRHDFFPTIAPDGSQVVFCSNRWGDEYALWVQDLDGYRLSGEPRLLSEQAGSASHPTFSPDGRWIAYYRIIEGQRDVWVIPRDGGVPAQITSDPADDSHPAWSGDGSRLAFASERSGTWRIWAVSMREGERVGDPVPLTPEHVSAQFPRWSPDGRWIAFAGYEETGESIWLMEVGNPSHLRRVPGEYFGSRMQWSSDGTRLYISTNGRNGATLLHCRDVETLGEAPLSHPVDFGFDSFYTNFDLPDDESTIVFTRKELNGDVWAFHGAPGEF